MKTLAFGLAAALLPLAAAADEVFLKSGGQLSGRVVKRTETTIEVDVGAGHITVPTSSVVRIQDGQSTRRPRAGRRRSRLPTATVEM